MECKEKSKRKIWTREETLLLLKCYAARKGEFQHSRKKKNAFEHVLEDMVFQGFADINITASAVEGKMKTLLSAYKSAKDNGKQTGAAPCVVPYMDELEEIFGDKPIISNVHTIHLGDIPISPLPTKSIKPKSPKGTPSEIPATIESTAQLVAPTVSTSLAASTSVTPSSTSGRNVNPRTPTRSRKVSAKEHFYSAKKKILEAKAKKQADFLDAMQKSLEEKWRRELEILKDSEEKKIKILENKNK